ncbi:hypothetical protein FA95DRAFT_925538 [Auriscalpium vulgare]|uniref:Uncharacterized protein n=1 Tax=Auriscalpium vulgare TaxID=40419 RepID=A0ACB8RZF9_9AGAM|nr:hypothetical protein FA95DRAFT_925538 [Auriscalpium vulgare]
MTQVRRLAPLTPTYTQRLLFTFTVTLVVRRMTPPLRIGMPPPSHGAHRSRPVPRDVSHHQEDRRGGRRTRCLLCSSSATTCTATRPARPPTPPQQRRAAASSPPSARARRRSPARSSWSGCTLNIQFPTANMYTNPERRRRRPLRLPHAPLRAPAP